MTKELQDLAWSILPKEFKEEVKRVANIFSRRTSGMLGGERTLADTFLNEFINLFGRHNLTSDAEGEEMLTVPRKKVQEFYVKCKEVTKNPYSYPDYSHESALSRMALLDILFGPKCLPDNVDSLDSNIDSLEPKPAEPKFKVGDYVRYKGGVHKVVATAKDNRCYLNKILGCIDESDLEPYTEPKENIAETRNFSQDCDKQVDTILKDSFAKERRLNIAAMIMAAMMQNAKWGDKYSHIATISCAAADALIIEVEKNK